MGHQERQPKSILLLVIPGEKEMIYRRHALNKTLYGLLLLMFSGGLYAADCDTVSASLQAGNSYLTCQHPVGTIAAVGVIATNVYTYGPVFGMTKCTDQTDTTCSGTWSAGDAITPGCYFFKKPTTDASYYFYGEWVAGSGWAFAAHTSAWSGSRLRLVAVAPRAPMPEPNVNNVSVPPVPAPRRAS